MTTKWMLIASGMSGLLLTAGAALGADLQPAVISPVGGTLHIVQDLPCGVPDADVITAATGGRIELIPAEGTDALGNKLFTITNGAVSFGGFSVRGECLGATEMRTFAVLNAQLAAAVSFVALRGDPGMYTFVIPTDKVLLYTTDVVNGQLEQSYRRPSQPVMGSINLTRGAFTMHVVLTQTIHFQGGCVGGVCAINENDDGTLTADLFGTIAFPDTDRDGVPDRFDNCRFVANPDQSLVSTPSISAPVDVTLFSCLDHMIGYAAAADVCNGGPITITNDAPGSFPIGTTVVTWTATDAAGNSATATQKVTVVDLTAPTVACMATHPPGTSFIVTASDACGGAPVVKLGSYVIRNGETIKIEETGRPGVRLQNVVSNDGIRKFLVGKGEAVIVATDASGNASTAVCSYPGK